MEWTNTAKVLEEYGEELKKKYGEELDSQKITTTGNLKKNVGVVIDTGENSIELSLSLLPYYKWVEEGRQPTRNRGKGEVREKIKEWITNKPGFSIQPMTDKNGKTYTPTVEQLSFIIARKVHTYGWYNEKSGDGYTEPEGKHPLQNSIDALQDKYLPLIEEAIGKDIENEIDLILVGMF